MIRHTVVFSLKHAAGSAEEGAFLRDARVEEVSVKIVKLALSEGDEKIGITLTRQRR